MSRAATPRRAGALLALALLLLPVTGCAWANRDNRPVWNAFEAHMVPEDDTAFYATLPLTVPGGLVAILLDTFVVHPAQVVDDAAGDAGDLWDDLGPKFEQHYYTHMAALPFRVVGTPVVFVFSFLGRSLFDIDPHGHDHGAETAEGQRRLEQRHARDLEVWLRGLAERRNPWHGEPPPATWSPELRALVAAALSGADTRGRLDLYQYAWTHAVPRDVLDPVAGLSDDDPVFRYLLLERWPEGSASVPIPAAVRAALRHDPSLAVRELAARRGL